MATWPNQQQVMPPTVIQPAGPQQGYSYDPSQVPMQPQQVAAPYYPGQPVPQQMQPQQQPQFVPPQTQYMQQPSAPQQPMQYQQQPQFAQPQRMQFDESVVLDGPGVAPELRGRTMGDAMRLYKALSSDWLTRQRQPITPAQQTLQAQGLAPQPQQFQQQPPALPPQPGQFQPQFTVPGAAQADQQGQFQQQLQQAVQQAVQPMLAPVVQQSQTQAIMQARDAARGAIADYGYLEADIIQNLNGATPEQLANPAVWQIAANAARGARVAAGQYQMQRPQPQLPGNGNGQRGPGMAVPAQQMQPAYQFFTESPTAPTVGAGLYGGQVRQATQEDTFYARQFGMPVDNYMAWKYGQQQPLGSY